MNNHEIHYEFFCNFLTLQNNFDKKICDTVFTNNSDHIYEKWILAESNIITFITFLDDYNKEKLFNWIDSSDLF